MTASRQKSKHSERVISIGRFTENVLVHNDDGVGRQDVAMGVTGQNREGLGLGDASCVPIRRFALRQRFVNVGGNDLEGNPRRSEQFRTPRRG